MSDGDFLRQIISPYVSGGIQLDKKLSAIAERLDMLDAGLGVTVGGYTTVPDFDPQPIIVSR